MTEEEKRLVFLFNKYGEKQKKKIMKRFEVHYKTQTRHITKKYMKENNISFTKCEVCGKDTYIEIHHTDYENPYLIIPLCLDCHMRQHSKKALNLAAIDIRNLKK